MGPCMCGDTQCSSCGPAQGNTRCAICRAWADDGCEHRDETGEYHAESMPLLKAAVEAEAALQMEREEAEFDEIQLEYGDEIDDEIRLNESED